MFETAILRTEAEIGRTLDSWTRLCESSPRAGLHHDPRWVLAQVRAFAGESGRLVLAAARNGDALAGLAPVLVRDWRWKCRAGYATVASFPLKLGVVLGELPLVADPDDPRLDAAVAEALGGALAECDMLHLESVPLGSAFAERLLAAAEREGAFWLHRPGPPSPHRKIRMPDSFEAYLAKFSGRTRRTLAYKARKLAEAAREAGGELVLERVTAPEEVAGFLERAAEIQRKSWQGRRLGHSLSEESHGERLRTYAREGWLRSYVLSAGKRPIAFVLGTQARGVYHYERPAYDPAWASHNPGNVLLYRMLEDLFAERRPDVFDFGSGENEYKRLFANESFEGASLYLVRKSLYTGLARATHGAVTTLAHVARRELDRFELRERVRHVLRGREARPPARAASTAGAG